VNVEPKPHATTHSVLTTSDKTENYAGNTSVSSGAARHSD